MKPISYVGICNFRSVGSFCFGLEIMNWISAGYWIHKVMYETSAIGQAKLDTVKSYTGWFEMEGIFLSYFGKFSSR